MKEKTLFIGRKIGPGARVPAQRKGSGLCKAGLWKTLDQSTCACWIELYAKSGHASRCKGTGAEPLRQKRGGFKFARKGARPVSLSPTWTLTKKLIGVRVHPNPKNGWCTLAPSKGCVHHRVYTLWQPGDLKNLAANPEGVRIIRKWFHTHDKQLDSRGAWS